ncbi:hypothetical protein [Methylomonas koyamae]|uniref:hypothetical protein n=1 Tax=Methylomonas koyamae TaxID=702114 RepID=UPI0021102839|nr:hypothetical protein [Methylomonas koyamae]
MCAVGFQHAPTGNVAEAFGLAANLALGVNGADAADDFAAVADYKSVIGLIRNPVLPKGLRPLLGATLVA